MISRWSTLIVPIAGAAVALAAIVTGARWILRATDPGDWRALQAENDSLRTTLVEKELRLDSMTRAAREAAAPHQEAEQATTAGAEELRRSIANARAALSQDSVAMVAALEELARRAEEQLRLQAIERQAASERIHRLEATVRYVPVVLGDARALVSVQDEQLDRVRRSQPWWRRLLGSGCAASVASGGGALGAAIGAVPGAAVGGFTGAIIGVFSCR
jgi:hypothetical protein